MNLRMPTKLRDKCRKVRTIGGKQRPLSEVCRGAWAMARKLSDADLRVVMREYRQVTTREESESYKVDPGRHADWIAAYSHPELCACIDWAIDQIDFVPPVPKELQLR